MTQKAYPAKEFNEKFFLALTKIIKLLKYLKTTIFGRFIFI